MSPMKTILFDWDGTLVDSMPAIRECQEIVCRVMGIPLDDEIFRRSFSPNWKRMYANLGIPLDRYDEAANVWHTSFRPDLMAPFPGVRDALAELAAAGHRLGLVTGGDRPGIEPQMTRIGVADLITVRVYAEETSAGKPHPDPLHLALKRAGRVRPRDAYYVGDALDDMRMAAAAEVHGVGIVSMVATADELVEAGAEEAADSVVEWAHHFLTTWAGRG
jgi:HAD superfamily hydrolase (TIGR01509 family)